MSNELNRVTKKLFGNEQVNLESQAVELGIAQGLNEMLSEAKRLISLKEDAIKWGKKAEDAQKIISDAYGILTNSNRSNTKLISESVKLYNEIDSKAKELGVKPELIDGYKETLSLIYKLQDSQNELTGWIDTLKKFKV